MSEALNRTNDLLAAVRRLTSTELLDQVEEEINRRYGGDIDILGALEIAFELSGVDAAMANASPSTLDRDMEHG